MPHVEKLNQILDIRLISAYRNTININRSEQALELIKPAKARIVVLIMELPAGSIDENNFTGFRILKLY